MIKIEITDPHLLDKKTLQETAAYLLSFTGGLQIPSEPYIQTKGRAELKPVFSETEQDINGLVGEEIIGENLIEPTSPVIKPDFNPFAPKASDKVEPVISDPKFDARGFPWDDRIHAKTKTKTADGCWRYMRGVPVKTIDMIEHELKINGMCFELDNDIPEPAIPIPPMTNIPVPPVNNIPTPPVLDITFPMVMSKITQGIMDKKITREDVFVILSKHNIAALPVLASRLDALPAVNAQLDELLK